MAPWHHSKRDGEEQFPLNYSAHVSSLSVLLLLLLFLFLLLVQRLWLPTVSRPSFFSLGGSLVRLGPGCGE